MFVGDEQDWTQYLSKMRMVKTWGDELTLSKWGNGVFLEYVLGSFFV